MKTYRLAAILILAFTFFVSCRTSVIEKEPRRVVIAGRVDNFDPQKPATFVINRVGLRNQEDVPLTFDEEGNFHGSFETYTPVDGWMFLRTNFLVLLNPGDSLYVRFDGNSGRRPELLETIQFGGTAAQKNSYIAQYQHRYFADPVYYDWDARNRAVKEYGVDDYLKYADTVRQTLDAIYDGWTREAKPDKQSRTWAKAMSDKHYYTMLSLYPGDHRRSNNIVMADSTDLPPGYFAFLDQWLPVTENDLAAGYALNGFVSDYRKRIYEKMWNDRSEEERSGEEHSWIVFPWGGLLTDISIGDSLIINGILKYAPDGLLKQIMLSKYFDGEFDDQEVDAFEKYRDIADAFITQPFLQEPLLERYTEVKARLEAPELYSEAVLKEVASSPAADIFDEILQSNKSKVIYIDFWATWCGPCIAEFPNSKAAEEELRDKDVAFVYICIESEHEAALATLAQYQLGGSHYILSPEQSRAMRAMFEIHAIPFYLLIDSSGVIRGSGSHLRPNIIKEEIAKL